MLLATTVTALVTAPAFAQDIRIGAMREGSSWYVFAATLERLIEPIFGDNSVEIIARGGGFSNPMVVQGGKAEIALSNVATAVWASQGSDIYNGMAAPDIRALVGGLNSVYIGVIASEEFIQKRGTKDLKEILQSDKPVRVLMKPVGSSAVPAAEMIFESLGTSVDEIKSNGVTNASRVSALGCLLRIARIQKKHVNRAIAQGISGFRGIPVANEFFRS